jgi:multisubunit Na+/H+ antiporter MnhF subunit
MHPVTFYFCVVVLSLCLGAVAVLVVRSRSRVGRILALDTLTMILVALLTLFSIERENAFYLKAGLALALLGFSGTLVAVRYRLGKELY